MWKKINFPPLAFLDQVPGCMKLQSSKMSHLHRNHLSSKPYTGRMTSVKNLRTIFWNTASVLGFTDKALVENKGLRVMGWAALGHQWLRRQHLAQNFWQSQHMKNTWSSKFQAWNFVSLKYKFKTLKILEVHFRIVVLGPVKWLRCQRFMLPSLKTWLSSIPGALVAEGQS